MNDYARWFKFNDYIEEHKRLSETGKTTFQVNFSKFGTEDDRIWYTRKQNKSKRDIMALDGLQMIRSNSICFIDVKLISRWTPLGTLIQTFQLTISKL